MKSVAIWFEPCLNLQVKIEEVLTDSLLTSQTKDSKVSGEAATQPSVRLPPLREGRLPKLMGAALGCRLQGGALPETDVIIMMDGRREGTSDEYES